MEWTTYRHGDLIRKIVAAPRANSQRRGDRLATIPPAASEPVAPMTSSQSCSECGAPFSCGCAASTCWCNDYPAILPGEFERNCRCPECLAKAIGSLLTERLAGLPVAEALQLARQHSPAARLIEHIDYTREQGFFVYSRWFLLKRGTCCGHGCRNCPYSASVVS